MRNVMKLACWICLSLLIPSIHAVYAASMLDLPMTDATAQFMLGRFGYGATSASLSNAIGMTPREYINRSIKGQSELSPSVIHVLNSMPIDEPVDTIWARLGPGGSARDGKGDSELKKQLKMEENQYAKASIQATILKMANGSNPGHEALLAFWVNHFSIFAHKGKIRLLAWDYVQTLERAMSTDSFEELLRASFYHPAMQEYLDNVRSISPSSPAAKRASAKNVANVAGANGGKAKKGKPLGINENLARELLELHTLGVKGGYTQKDVQELARIITGAGVHLPNMQDRNLERAGVVRKQLFQFDPRRHDFEEKVFLGNRFPAGEGMTEIDRALHLMAMHPDTARHVSSKLAQRFLQDTPPKPLVDAMAAKYLSSGGKISETLWPLLNSQEFAKSIQHPEKFKEPIDYVLSAARTVCDAQPIVNAAFLHATLADMGQLPLMRSTPDGYGATEADWLSPAAMAKRIRFAVSVTSGKPPFAREKFVMKDGNEAGEKNAACVPNDKMIARRIAGASKETVAASQSLSNKERVGLWLASPEFMRR